MIDSIVKAAPAPSPKGKKGVAETGRIHAIFARFAAKDPHPKGDSTDVNPFTLLVAVVLSAQATDVGVNRATKDLFALASTPQKMLALGEEGVREKIRTIGLFCNKAKNVIALSRKLIERFRVRGSRVAARRSKACRASAARPPMSS